MSNNRALWAEAQEEVRKATETMVLARYANMLEAALETANARIAKLEAEHVATIDQVVIALKPIAANGNKIGVIKAVRQMFHLGLKEAKDAVDKHIPSQPWTTPTPWTNNDSDPDLPF